MPWYIPLLSAAIGASLGFFASFIVTKVQFNRQLNQERRVLLSSFDIEISAILLLFQRSIDSASPQTIIPLPSKKEIENICGIYRGNCGKIGTLPDEVAIEIVRFYTSVLSMQPSEIVGSTDRYESDELQDYIRCGKIVCNSIRTTR